MLSSVGGLAEPSLSPVLTLGGLWLLMMGSLGLWCRRLSSRLAALDRVSTLDPLTGLGNGRLFESERWPAAMRTTQPLAVLHVDLDHLKQNNDLYGRAAGDRYIVRAAMALHASCRRGVDEVFRLHTAGDEFIVIVRGPEALQADIIAQHIVGKLGAQNISASVGAAWTASSHHLDRAKLLDAAEGALHRAKAAGRGRAVTVPLSVESDEDGNEAVPEAITEEWTNPRRCIAPSDRVAALLYRIRDDVRLAFPSHRISLSITESLPLLTADDGRFILAIATLLLHIATISRHAHITARLGTRAGLLPESSDDAAPMLRVCVEFHQEEDATKPSLLEVCNRVCEQEGGAWMVQANCICLAWPRAHDSRPLQPTLRLVADKPAALVAGAGGAS